MHAENGFLKVLPKKSEKGGDEAKCAELMLSHPFSVNEISVGWFDLASKKFEVCADGPDKF